MIILGIETSCDETAVAIVKDGRHILSNVIVSQIDIFAKYGGVIPEVSARSHLEVILSVIERAFLDADLTIPSPSDPTRPLPDWSKIDTISVTHTPGLLGSLLIGTLTARTLAILHDKPLFPVHHLKSHIYANWLTTSSHTPTFPLLALVISGGHTQIIHMQRHNHFNIIGTTRDDAIGECFDKIAKILGLPYPGGPAIAKIAQNSLQKAPQNTLQSTNQTSFSKSPLQNSQTPPRYSFPHPKVENLDFSFSGLKTAVLRAVQKELGKPISFPSHQLAPLLTSQQITDFATSFQKTAIDILIEKLQLALKKYPIKSVVFAGGVSANQYLRYVANSTLIDQNIFFPAPSLSGDNGAMVASAAFYEIQSGTQPTDPYHLDIAPRSPIS